MLRSTWRGLETWHGRDDVTLADERARQQGTQTSTYTGAPVLDPTCERPRVKFLGPTRQTRHINDVHAMSALPVRRGRRRFPVGVSPTRQPLQPEAIGAVMEVTKWLKPSISVSRIGDSASVQAITRVNAEQTSKRTMRTPTRQGYRGRLIRQGE